MRYMLVLQWPASTISDYDVLVNLENLIVENLPKGSQLDGHDTGSGEMNLFILTKDPESAFESVKALLRNEELWAEARAAYRRLEGSDYTILWPKDLKEFKVA